MRIVVLQGADQFLVPRYTADFVAVLEAKLGAVEQFRFNGENVELATVLDELRSYGLMQQHKLVIVDNADRFLSGRSNDDGTTARASTKGTGGARKALERYAADPVPDATLLLRAERWNKGRLDAAIGKVGLVHKIKPLTENETVRWCMLRAEREHGAKLDEDAARLLVLRIGTGLARLDVELSKLAAHVLDAGDEGPEVATQRSITVANVKLLVGLSREEQAWEIQDALLSGDTAATLTKLRDLTEVSRQPEVLISWSMVDLLRKLHGTGVQLGAGASTQEIRSSQRLFGPGANRIMEIARRGRPARFARLMGSALDAEARTRSGYGHADHALECLAIRIADSIGTT